MSFGIGINAQGADAGQLKGEQLKICCLSWCTSEGEDPVPVFIKFKDENDEIQSTRDINVYSHEKKNYSGIPSIEYDCAITVGEEEQKRRLDVRLIFYQMETRWVLNYR